MNDKKSRASVSLINRRDFILLSSAAVAGLTVTDLRAATRAAAVDRAVSIGFWGGLPAVARRGAPGAPSFENAFALTQSDPAFLRAGARVSVRGLWRPESQRNTSRFVAVNQIFHDGPDAVPYFAWTLNNVRGQASQSSPVTYQVPVETDQSIDIEVLHGRSPADASRSLVSMSPYPVAGKVMLNAGTYIVALGDSSAAPVPDWSAVRLLPGITPASFGGEGRGLISVNGGKPAFDYLVITVAFPAAANVAAESDVDAAVVDVPAAIE